MIYYTLSLINPMVAFIVAFAVYFFFLVGLIAKTQEELV